MVLTGVGFWSTFTLESCHSFYLVPISSRVIQYMVSQAILGLRTYGISGKNRTVCIVLLSSYVFAAAVQWVASIYRRVPVLVDGACAAGTTNPALFLSPWLFYLVAILYDLLASTISMAYLFKSYSSSLFTSRLVRIMISDGLIYFVALMVVNIVFAVLYRTTNFIVQTAATPFAGALTWILSQRILIHLQNAASRRPRYTPPIIRPPKPNLNVPIAIRPGPRDMGDHELDKDTDSSFVGSSRIGSEPVQVHVEHSVVVGVRPLTPAPYDESSRTPMIKWNEGQVSQ
ncbi:hypothetical protein EI94DRAFT_631705 [Lactarius quietus]|nr:hypothetical protein EI94DRAFT_631705 [Lactarius quietus]